MFGVADFLGLYLPETMKIGALEDFSLLSHELNSLVYWDLENL